MTFWFAIIFVSIYFYTVYYLSNYTPFISIQKCNIYHNIDSLVNWAGLALKPYIFQRKDWVSEGNLWASEYPDWYQCGLNSDNLDYAKWFMLMMWFTVKACFLNMGFELCCISLNTARAEATFPKIHALWMTWVKTLNTGALITHLWVSFLIVNTSVSLSHIMLERFKCCAHISMRRKHLKPVRGSSMAGPHAFLSATFNLSQQCGDCGVEGGSRGESGCKGE